MNSASSPNTQRTGVPKGRAASTREAGLPMRHDRSQAGPNSERFSLYDLHGQHLVAACRIVLAKAWALLGAPTLHLRVMPFAAYAPIRAATFRRVSCTVALVCGLAKMIGRCVQ